MHKTLVTHVDSYPVDKKLLRKRQIDLHLTIRWINCYPDSCHGNKSNLA